MLASSFWLFAAFPRIGWRKKTYVGFTSHSDGVDVTFSHLIFIWCISNMVITIMSFWNSLTFFLTYVKCPWSTECTISQTSPDNDLHPSPLSQPFYSQIYAFSKSHTAYMKFHFSTTSFKYVNFSLTQNESTCLFLDLEELHFAPTFSWPVATISKN